jgi:hypothetical protein
MTEMRAKDAFPLEADLLSHALRGEVFGIGYELDTRQLELLERVSREESQRASTDAPATRGRSNPVPDARAVAARAQAQ